MGRAHRHQSGGGPSPTRNRRRFVTLAAFAALVVLCACGQVPGAHPTGAGVQAAGRVAASPSVSPNGENAGPPAGTHTYDIIIGTTTKPRRPSEATPLVACPVRGSGSFSDDFGAPRYAGGYHPHQGNDVFAAGGTPVVAPFDGVAVRTPNLLGGNAVKVFGPLGYAYLAHLSAYGKQGPVRAQEIVGYVGNTGDAAGGPTHLHFEWHPGNGPAVDPFTYLRAACT
ncbi:MAG TPA: M23 family metallopeptidase [Actinomycetota bacterium]|nr:M23 family metallopeptidase [Actinomycetota bacterium]